MVGRALTSEGSFLARLGIGSPGHHLSLVVGGSPVSHSNRLRPVSGILTKPSV